jgi:hypothetical protein
MAKRFLMVGVLVALSALVLSACEGMNDQSGYRVHGAVSVEDIVQNFDDYFSVKYDRNDLSRGTAELRFWKGDRMTLHSSVLPAFKQNVVKREAWGERKITIGSEHSFRSVALTGVVPGKVRLNYLGKEIALSVGYQIVANSGERISGEIGDRLLALPREGDHRFRVRIEGFQGDAWDGVEGSHYYYSIANLRDLEGLLEERSRKHEQWFDLQVAKLLDTDASYLAAKDEYRKVKEGFDSITSSEESSLYFKKMDAALAGLKLIDQKIQERVMKKIGPRSSSPEEIMADVVFIIPVGILEIDGIKMSD